MDRQFRSVLDAVAKLPSWAKGVVIVYGLSLLIAGSVTASRWRHSGVPDYSVSNASDSGGVKIYQIVVGSGYTAEGLRSLAKDTIYRNQARMAIVDFFDQPDQHLDSLVAIYTYPSDQLNLMGRGQAAGPVNNPIYPPPCDPD